MVADVVIEWALSGDTGLGGTTPPQPADHARDEHKVEHHVANGAGDDGVRRVEDGPATERPGQFRPRSSVAGFEAADGEQDEQQPPDHDGTEDPIGQHEMVLPGDGAVAEVQALEHLGRPRPSEKEEQPDRHTGDCGEAQQQHAPPVDAARGEGTVRSGHYISLDVVTTTFKEVARKINDTTLLESAVAATLAGGLAELTFGRLSRRTGISDRMLVYYFGDKAQLVERVMQTLAQRLIGELETAFGPDQLPVPALVAKAWPVLTGATVDRIFAVWLELAGRAATNHEPERRLAEQITSALLEWCSTKVQAPTPATRRCEAALLATVLDGALLLHHLGQPSAARAAVRALAR